MYNALSVREPSLSLKHPKDTAVEAAGMAVVDVVVADVVVDDVVVVEVVVVEVVVVLLEEVVEVEVVPAAVVAVCCEDSWNKFKAQLPPHIPPPPPQA